MSIPATLATYGGIGGFFALASVVAQRIRPGRFKVSAQVISDQAEAAREQTRAIDRQTKASLAAVAEMTKLAVRMDAAFTEMGQLTTEVRGVRSDLHSIDRRMIRLETTHEHNGTPGHGHGRTT